MLVRLYGGVAPSRERGRCPNNTIRLSVKPSADLEQELAHEFGHLLGFKDFYRDAYDSQRRTIAIPYPGFEDDMMGTGDRVKVEHIMLLIESYKKR